jgi:hypothetical protein
MRKLVKIFALAALLAPAVASAQLSLGARVGYAFGMGKVSDTDQGDMSEFISGQIPIQIDVGFRVTPDLTLGGYFGAGYGLLGDAVDQECDDFDLDCSARVLRLGVQVDYAFRTVSPTMTPWIGAGVGYEWASVHQEDGSDELDSRVDGFEFLNLQGGVDWKVGGFSVGPFAMLTIAQYANFEQEGLGENISGDIDEKALHQWLQIGLRGRFDL